VPVRAYRSAGVPPMEFNSIHGRDARAGRGRDGPATHGRDGVPERERMRLGAQAHATASRWWVNDRTMNKLAAAVAARMRLTADVRGRRVEELSGGNQQKVVLARWLLVHPPILIVDEPTRGIDIGAKREVHQLLRTLADEGAAVVLISSELPEILAVADRILVMREGRLVGEVPRAGATEESIMRLAAILR
jgi:ABC-type sugar transport system ATPase subunit